MENKMKVSKSSSQKKIINKINRVKIIRKEYLELVKTMFFAMLLIDTAITHKKKMLGVILKSMITDITKVFNEYVKMWIRDIDDNVLRIK